MFVKIPNLLNILSRGVDGLGFLHDCTNVLGQGQIFRDLHAQKYTLEVVDSPQSTIHEVIFMDVCLLTSTIISFGSLTLRARLLSGTIQLDDPFPDQIIESIITRNSSTNNGAIGEFKMELELYLATLPWV